MKKKKASPWRHVPRLLLAFARLFRLFLVGIFLYIAAHILAALGRKNLLESMNTTLRRWHLLPPKTEDEKQARVLSRTDWTLRRHGLSWLGFAWYVFILKPWRNLMGHFLEEKTAELRAALNGRFLLEIAKKNDTGLVLSATNMLDEFIGMAIILRFHVVLTKSNYERVFEGNGPLGTFSAKIALGTALGILVGDMSHDLTILRKLRNDFAHAVHPPALSDHELSERCKSLKSKWETSEEIRNVCSTPERISVVESVAMIILQLAIIIQRGVTERTYMTKYEAEISAEAKSEVEKWRNNALAT